MHGSKSDILARLQKEILPLQGFKPAVGNVLNIGLDEMEASFPNNRFPLGAVHEFICESGEQLSAGTGFVSALVAGLLRNGGACIWISSSRTLFPPALKHFGIEPDRIVFMDLKREKDLCWAMEEALKCAGLAAVVGEIREMDFTASRRLQLAVEQSRVTGFILRKNSGRINTTACLSRWKISPVPSAWEDDMPGPGFPRWQVELQKIRNGRPGSWQVEWSEGKLNLVKPSIPWFRVKEKRKAG